ncbi:MAG: hypothetical protein KTR35_16530, partial [Gammaproteobacteria bacterium]|nr:hypothetical protein [Gammaproteobacteria bacterium]
MNTLSKLLLFASAWLVLTSCDSGVPSSDSGSNNLTLGTPLFLSVKAVDEEQLTPELQVNGSPIALTALGGGQYAGTVQVPEGSDVTIEISWTEMYEGTTPLMLARFTQTINGINQNLGIRIRDEDYDKSLDEDSDGISNLQERIDDTDPFDQFDPADGGIRVNVPYIDPEIAPVIDGSWETVWNRATFLDRNDETLFIDNLMINQGAIREDGDTEYRWGAMHDGVNLYLWV